MIKKQKIMRSKVKEYPEIHQRGIVKFSDDAIELLKHPLARAFHNYCDFGIQIATDGRIWICINGVSFLHFKPSIKVVTQEKPNEK